MVPKRFADHSFQAIPVARSLAVLFRNREAQPGNTSVVATAQHGKPFVATAGGFFEHPAESRSIQQPAVLAKPVPGAAFQLGWAVCRWGDRVSVSRGLRRELRAAFGPAALENEAACLGRHAGTETVRSGAL